MNLTKSIAVVELYKWQINVALNLEMAYNIVSDHPDVAKEVRLTALSARNQHMQTTGMMKSFNDTAKFIAGKLISIISDAYASQIITKAKEMKQDAVDKQKQYNDIQMMINKEIAQMNAQVSFVSNKQKQLDTEKDEVKKLAVENERAAKELDEEKNEMVNKIKNLNANSDKWMEKTGNFFFLKAPILCGEQSLSTLSNPSIVHLTKPMHYK